SIDFITSCGTKMAYQVGRLIGRPLRAGRALYNYRVPFDPNYKIRRSCAEDAANGKAEPQPAIGPAPPIQQEEPTPGPTTPEEHEDEDAQDPIEVDAEAIAAQPVTTVNIDAINAGLAPWGIEPVNTTISAMPPIPPSSPPEPNNNAAGNGGTNSGNSGKGRDDAPGAKTTSNGHDPSRGDYKHADPTDEPYSPIRIRLINRGYRLARSFDFMLPGGTALFTEDRYELAAHIQAVKTRPRKTCRFHHNVNGAVYSGTDPRRIIYNWPAIMAKGPGAT